LPGQNRSLRKSCSNKPLLKTTARLCRCPMPVPSTCHCSKPGARAVQRRKLIWEAKQYTECALSSATNSWPGHARANAGFAFYQETNTGILETLHTLHLSRCEFEFSKVQTAQVQERK
jgi:hypothetical protein